VGRWSGRTGEPYLEKPPSLNVQLTPHEWMVRWCRRLLLPLVIILPILGTARWLNSGWMRDDYVHRLLFSRQNSAQATLARLGYGQTVTSPLSTMFSFIDGGSGQSRMRDTGVLPWWVVERAKCSYFRPLSASTHWLDFQLWPENPGLMHLHTTLWLVALAGLAFWLFRTVEWNRGAAGGVAALLYASHGHATASAWLANRNALVYSCFAVGSLILFVRYRRNRSPAFAMGAYACYCLALLAGEGGVCVLAYLLAYAVSQRAGSVWERVRSVLPFVGITGAWYFAYNWLGYGAIGCPGYTNPIGETVQFLKEFPGDYRDMVSMAYGVNIGPAPLRIVWCLLLLFGGVLMATKSRTSRFWLAGSLLSMAPLVATTPHVRHMLIPALGAVAITAELACWLATWCRPTTQLARAISTACGAAAVSIVVVHLISTIGEDGRLVKRELGAEAILNQVVDFGNMSIPPAATVIMLRSPGEFHNFYAPALRYWRGLEIPDQSLVLGPRGARGTLTRTGPTTVVVRPHASYALPGAVEEATLTVGTTHIHVGSRSDGGMPSIVDFTFAFPVDAPSVIWVRWDPHERRFLHCRPPRVGESLEFGGDLPCSG
jgi:hypothetical protein